MLSLARAVELTEPRLSQSQLARHAAAGTLRAVKEAGVWFTTEDAIREFNARPRRSGPKLGQRRAGRASAKP